MKKSLLQTVLVSLPLAQFSGSFLLLFFKKEVLASLRRLHLAG
jgi:hypothetical protein